AGLVSPLHLHRVAMHLGRALNAALDAKLDLGVHRVMIVQDQLDRSSARDHAGRNIAECVRQLLHGLPCRLAHAILARKRPGDGIFRDAKLISNGLHGDTIHGANLTSILTSAGQSDIDWPSEADVLADGPSVAIV